MGVSPQHLGTHVIHNIKHGAFGDSGFAKFCAERIPPIMQAAANLCHLANTSQARLRDVTGRAGLLLGLAPQVGLEPTTLRLTAGSDLPSRVVYSGKSTSWRSELVCPGPALREPLREPEGVSLCTTAGSESEPIANSLLVGHPSGERGGQ